MLRTPPVGGLSPTGRPRPLAVCGARFWGRPPPVAGRRRASPTGDARRRRRPATRADPAQPAVRTMSSYRGRDASLELGFALCCHSNATRAPIANPPNSAQLGGSLYHTANGRLGGVSARCRPLLEATTAAAVRPPWADLPSLSVLAILRASINEMPFSAFSCWTLFSKSHLGQLLLKAEWLPVQLGHFASFVQSLLVWPIWPHVAQVSLPLHAFLPWPNFWHLKQRSGLGMYGETGTLM